MNLGDIDKAAQAASSDAGLQGETGNLAQTCPKAVLEVGVFFDGTLNNLYNVEDGSREDGSYQASKSNSALLYALYKDRRDYDEENSCGGIARAFRSTYIEGPGSTSGAEDDGIGYALGMGGGAGVAARVNRGFNEVLRYVNLMGGAPYLSEVKLDVFGFSRGAAAARYFFNCIRDGQMSLDVGRGQRIHPAEETRSSSPGRIRMSVGDMLGQVTLRRWRMKRHGSSTTDTKQKPLELLPGLQIWHRALMRSAKVALCEPFRILLNAP